METTQGNLNQQPMFDAINPSLSYSSFRPKSNMIMTDVSFSSYHPPCESNRTAADDSELSIFDARKYFNENNDQVLAGGNNRVSLVKECYSDFGGVPRLSSASSSVEGFGRNFRVRSFHSYATPTAPSEASWNSHTGLLSNPPGAVSVTLREPTTERKTGRSSQRWMLLRRKCPCLGKKSVRVEERSSEPRTPTPLKLHDLKSRELSNSKVQVDIAAAGKARSTASADSDVLKIIANPSRHHENKFKEMIAPHRFSCSDAEKNFQPHQDAQRVSLSVLASRRPFIDANTARFSFPILNPPLPSTSSPPMKMVLNDSSSPPRDSLEIFQPLGSHMSRNSTENNDNRSQLRVMPASLPPRDHRAFALPPSPKSRLSTAMNDDEAASDASSDLFEIESFSTQTTSFPGCNRHRDSLDEARPRFYTNTGLYNCLDDQPMTPNSTAYATTEGGYEPSEASIAWSVTTAEGTQFDKASLTNYSISASDVEEFTKMQLKLHHELEKNNIHDSGGCSKKRGNGLLSCRCEKAVSVGPNPVKWMPEMGPGLGQGLKKGPTPPAVTASTRHVSSRPPTAHKPPVASSRSTRLSLTFAT